jgi:hypothetical protein
VPSTKFPLLSNLALSEKPPRLIFATVAILSPFDALYTKAESLSAVRPTNLEKPAIPTANTPPDFVKVTCSVKFTEVVLNCNGLDTPSPSVIACKVPLNGLLIVLPRFIMPRKLLPIFCPDNAAILYMY